MKQLLQQPPRTVRYIPGDARELFRKVYTAVLNLFAHLPSHSASDTAAFLHQQVIALLNSLPALLVAAPSSAPLGTIACIDLINTNCRKFLEGKWSALFRCALNFPSPQPRSALLPLSDSDRQDQRHKLARQQIRAGSLSSAYNILTGPGLYPADPLDHFRQIHRTADLSKLDLHTDIV